VTNDIRLSLSLLSYIEVRTLGNTGTKRGTYVRGKRMALTNNTKRKTNEIRISIHHTCQSYTSIHAHQAYSSSSYIPSSLAFHNSSLALLVTELAALLILLAISSTALFAASTAAPAPPPTFSVNSESLALALSTAALSLL